MLPLLLMLGGTGLSMAGKVAGGLAEKQAEKQNARDARLNAKLTRMQAMDVLAQAEQNVGDIKDNGKAFASGQLASMAAQGVDVSSGVTQDILTDTGTKVAEDARRTYATARKEAWGLSIQAQQYDTQAKRAEKRARYALVNGVLGATGSGAEGLGQALPLMS
jgi:hypothetical protein